MPVYPKYSFSVQSALKIKIHSIFCTVVNRLCILYSQAISALTSYISSIQWPQVATGHIRQSRSRKRYTGKRLTNGGSISGNWNGEAGGRSKGDLLFIIYYFVPFEFCTMCMHYLLKKKVHSLK